MTIETLQKLMPESKFFGKYDIILDYLINELENLEEYERCDRLLKIKKRLDERNKCTQTGN